MSPQLAKNLIRDMEGEGLTTTQVAMFIVSINLGGDPQNVYDRACTKIQDWLFEKPVIPECLLA